MVIVDEQSLDRLLRQAFLAGARYLKGEVLIAAEQYAATVVADIPERDRI